MTIRLTNKLPLPYKVVSRIRQTSDIFYGLTQSTEKIKQVVFVVAFDNDSFSGPGITWYERCMWGYSNGIMKLHKLSTRITDKNVIDLIKKHSS